MTDLLTRVADWTQAIDLALDALHPAELTPDAAIGGSRRTS